MAVYLVVLVFPYRCAAFASVFGNGYVAMSVRHGAVCALHKFGVPLGATPVLLYTRAGFAHIGRYHGFWSGGKVLWHGWLLARKCSDCRL